MSATLSMCLRSLAGGRSKFPITVLSGCRINKLNYSSTATGQTNTANEQSAEPNGQDINAKIVGLEEQNKKLVEDIKTIDDKYKRSLAENENVRQRMRKQIEEAKQFGIQGFCKDLLEVADVLTMAIDTVPKEALSPSNPHLQQLFEGLKMTEAQIMSVFRRHGLTQINPMGYKFDPNEHQALFEMQDPAKEPGTVAVVSKLGYKLHERVIRPAMVGVVKKS